MNNIDELRQTADDLKKSEDFDKACSLYEKIWNENRDQCNKWDGWNYAYCLRKCGKTLEALDISREVYKLDSSFEINNNNYAWCIYDLYIKIEEEKIKNNEEAFFKAANTIIKITKQGQYTPYVRTVFKVLDYLKVKAIYPSEKILEWTDKLDPSLLSTEAYKFENSESKQMENASDKERWFSYKTKAFEKLKNYKACIVLSEEALSVLKDFHYDNDLWFKMRIALCKWKLGEKDESHINEIKDILTRRKEWFLQFDLAEFFHEIGKDDEAMKYALDAALNFGDVDKKGKVFMLLAHLLKSKEKNELAAKHILLYYNFIKPGKRKNSEQTIALLNEFGVTASTNIDSKTLLNELKSEWNKLKAEFNEVHTGIINKFIIKEPDREFGFIKDDKTGNDFYFKGKAFRGNKSNLKQGLKVKYFVEESFDHIKNRKSEIAINVEEIK